MVRINFYGVIRGITGESGLELDFEGSMGELLDVLCGLYPALRRELGMSLVLLNNKTYENTDAVGDGDEVTIMPALGGG
jgi:molybdopterin converting factor small subunit